MEEVPNEVLEKIISYIPDAESLWACRLVGKRWNEITAKFWRALPTSRVAFLTDQRMTEFLSEMDFRIQDFPFARFRFIHVNIDNVTAVKELLRECSTYIQHLDIRELDESLQEGNEIEELLSCLDTSVLPNLEQLRIEQIPVERVRGQRMELLTAVMPELSLLNLRVLRLPFLSALFTIPASLVRGAPNLELLEIPIEITDETPFWSLPESCKQIKVIQVNLEIRIRVDVASTTLSTLLTKLKEWGNVQVQKLKLGVVVEHYNLIPRTVLQIQRLLNRHADFIKTFTLSKWPSTFNHLLKMPTMTELTDLELTFHHNRNPLQNIENNPFSQLQVVTLGYCLEPITVFSKAKLETVHTFVLNNSVTTDVTDTYTRWDKVFPNLTSFTYSYDQTARSERENYKFLAFLVSHMRMDSLAHVHYKVGVGRAHDFEGRKKERILGRMNQIFSGLPFPKDILGEAREARELGGKEGEETYWQSIDKFRSPCLVNMKGLKTFQFDVPIDDNFATAVLLRLNTLDLLRVDAKDVSLGVFCQMISRHNSFCSESDGS